MAVQHFERPCTSLCRLGTPTSQRRSERSQSQALKIAEVAWGKSKDTCVSAAKRSMSERMLSEGVQLKVSSTIRVRTTAWLRNEEETVVGRCGLVGG